MIARPAVMIGIAGYAGVGKDVVAAMLGMVGFERRAFADQLRREAAEAVWQFQAPMGWDGEEPYPELRLSLKDVNTFTKLLRTSYEHVYDSLMWDYLPMDVWKKPTPPVTRTLLQMYGTEFRRQIYGEDYWVKQTLTAPYPPRLVISDVRFENEAVAIRQLGGVIWKIVRSEVDTDSAAARRHASERGAESICEDVQIVNNGSLWDLSQQVRQEVGKIDDAALSESFKRGVRG